MKKILLIIGLGVMSFNSFAQVNNNETKTLEQTTYTPLTEERYNKIEDLANEMEILIPIRIENEPREDLIKFYIQTYNDKIVSSWMDFAYKKMTKFNLIESGSVQDDTFKSLMKKEQNRANLFLFMSAMTDNQIETVGF